MQEDKASNWIASELRKQQEENQLPYELGAWEAFEKKRAAIARKKTAYWISGIAASLALLLVAGGIWVSTEMNSGADLTSDQIALAEKSPAAGAERSQEETSDNSESKVTELTLDNSSEKTKTEISVSAEKSVNQSGSQILKEANPSTLKPEPKSKNQALKENQILPLKAEQRSVPEKTENPEVLQTLIAVEDKVSKTEVAEEKAVAKAELPSEPELTEEEIEEILETKSFTRIAMGLYPGFGASQGTDQVTSGSSLGLGVMLDMEITGKLIMGSGLAVNYLNQASESQSYAQVAGFSSAVTEKNEIAQVQVDIPLFFKYPITRSQSISVQAGFSNLITFNQSAEQESSYTRQVAVLDANAAGSNSFTLKSESVNQLTVLETPQNRFYPFATANLGVNFRLFESKKTSYEVMPFYNYPLQEFSGYGEKLGMFGASFKVNFGAIQKK